jgi:hypothetical protein
MSKPIILSGPPWTLTVKGSVIVNVEGKPGLDRHAVTGRGPKLPPDLPVYRFQTKAQAMSMAHFIGRYILGLGDLVFTYVEERKPS